MHLLGRVPQKPLGFESNTSKSNCAAAAEAWRAEAAAEPAMLLRRSTAGAAAVLLRLSTAGAVAVLLRRFTEAAGLVSAIGVRRVEGGLIAKGSRRVVDREDRLATLARRARTSVVRGLAAQNSSLTMH